jgi:hypothetical protein
MIRERDLQTWIAYASKNKELYVNIKINKLEK